LVVSIGHNRFLILHTVFLLDVLASQALQNPTPMSTKAKSEVSAAIRIAGVSTIVGAVSIAVAVLAIQDTGTESSLKLHPELLVCVSTKKTAIWTTYTFVEGGATAEERMLVRACHIEDRIVEGSVQWNRMNECEGLRVYEGWKDI
jgi:hypothetical protein